MRNSKFLKGLCYILIPILLLILCISVLYELDKNDYDYYNNDLNYFETDAFLADYMFVLSDKAYKLIYKNSEFNSIMDTESNIKICYNPSENNYYYNQIENYYYLIIYKNLAITNIELTTNTNSIEKLKNYIQGLDAQKANIINGTVQADSKIIETKALQYFDDFENSYYSIVENGTTLNEEVEVVSEEGASRITTKAEPIIQKEYYTSAIEDFQIYTSYEEKLTQRSDIVFYKKFIDILAPYECIYIPAIPICSILLLIMSVYLIISIGHTKNKEEIDLNDFDKLPIEILFIAFIIIICIFAAVVSEFSYSTYSEEALNYFSLFVSGLVTIYFITYISFILLLVTTIKRIKAKKLISTSLAGKCLNAMIKIFRSFIRKIKNFIREIIKDWNITVKVVIGTILLILILIFMVLAFSSGLGIIIDAFIIGFVLYKIVNRINCYKKIEEHLQNMYEGKEVENLNASDFTPEFKDIVKYINDISNGFENAKEEGIKSERMKTELITNVSHDIKTPLTSIINYVDLLKKEEIENEKAREYIEVLDGKSQRLKKLTEDLVEASKASSGAVKLNIEKLNIIELIKQTTGEFEDKFKEKKLEIISSMPKEDIFINADSRYMYRIIENLFSNISKYALDSSRVYIDVKNDDLKVKISIKNISKDKLNISAEELIQRFVRGDKSRTTEGSGLGLSISQSLTELQKGKFVLNVDGDLFKVELEFDIVK